MVRRWRMSNGELPRSARRLRGSCGNGPSAPPPKFCPTVSFVFFFNDTATPEIYTLSLHDALPIPRRRGSSTTRPCRPTAPSSPTSARDRKSTRLNSSHVRISYAVFCLKKKKRKKKRKKNTEKKKKKRK